MDHVENKDKSAPVSTADMLKHVSCISLRRMLYNRFCTQGPRLTDQGSQMS